MSIRLKVQPEILKVRASETQELIGQLDIQFQEIYDIVSRTKGYWVGTAGDRAREEFQSTREETQQVIRRFSEHPADLLMMANLYEGAEEKVKQANQKLSTDIVV